MRLIECVPNFSEGRDPQVVAQIVEVIRSCGVFLLDHSRDPDHNRCVVTFAGEPDAVCEAAFQAIRVAAQLIDLTRHSGVHPRIGAADVVPLVPLRGVSLAECAEMAARLGERVAEEIGLPVYLYEAAARRPERANLAVVRRDPYEVLRETIRTDPERAPDFGTAALGTAGAVAIGARAPLIAFNVYLDTADVDIAQRIAQQVRASGGGLPYIKALGLLVDGRAQVSVNVIDYRQTSLYTLMEALRAAAHAHGTRITESELIGLIPQAALFDCALSYLQLPAGSRGQVLEHRLGDQTGDYRELPFE